MVEANNHVEGDADVGALFVPPVRWGYQYVEPPAAAPSPERENPPQRAQVRLIARARAAGLWEAAALAALGGVGAIVLDATFGFFGSGGVKGTANGIGVLIVHLLAGAIGFWAARAWFRSSGDTAQNAVAVWRSRYVPWLNALATFCAPYLVLPVEAIRGWRRISRERGDLVPHPGETKRAEAEYAEASAAWQQRITQFEDAERRRVEGLAVWYPVPLSPSARVTCVFGGTSVGWTAALTTLGASLLGSGARVLVGDLSRRLTADVLCELARASGFPTAEAVLPGAAGDAALLTDVSWDDLSTVLVEVLHSAQRDPDASRRERQEDRSVIRDVADCLDPSVPVSIARLRLALLVVQGAPSPANARAVLDSQECARLATLFNEVQRSHGRVLERVTRIERALRDFELLDGASGEKRVGNPGEIDRGEQQGELRVVGVDKLSDDLENGGLVDLLFQLLLRRVRRGFAQADVLVVLGADRIRREALESLIVHADQAQLTVVLLFEHLRQDAIELVGTGGAAAAFMTLGNHREAREASYFIGAEYKWVESQQTSSASASLTRTPGGEESIATAGTLGLPALATLARSKTSTRSYSEAFGQSVEYTRSEARVREAVIEPEVLMGLPITGMIRVEVAPGGQRVVTNVDCHPQIAFSPRISSTPA